MSSEIKREVGCFSADFRDGTVSICGLTFPSGYFFMNAMNEYWKPYDGDNTEDFEIAQKLLAFRSTAKSWTSTSQQLGQAFCSSPRGIC